jgi:hypothetical protein
MEVEPLGRDAVMAIRHPFDEPVFRVDFWRQFEPVGDTPREDMGWKQDAYRIRDADGAEQVREWAEAHADGRAFVIYVELETFQTIVRIEGRDPTKPTQWAKRRP